jgi:hypothetical protein
MVAMMSSLFIVGLLKEVSEDTGDGLYGRTHCYKSIAEGLMTAKHRFVEI